MTDDIHAAISTAGEEHANAHQLEHRLLHLAAQVEVLERSLETVLDLSRSSQDQLSVLVQNAFDPKREQGLNTQLAELAAALHDQGENAERLDTRTNELATNADMQTLLASVARQEQLVALEDRMAKLVRTQFKTNTLNESQLGQLEGALAALSELAERRQTRQVEHEADAHLRLDEARTLGRRTLAADLLPAIDGLELALENGRAWTAHQSERLAKMAALGKDRDDSVATRWQRLRVAWNQPSSQAPPTEATYDVNLGREMLGETRAWLAGLELVHERFTGLLAADGIQPIDALGKPFDPRLHVAIDTIESVESPPDTVAQVVRTGYRQGEQVIRYAEVVVVRASAPPAAAS